MLVSTALESYQAETISMQSSPGPVATASAQLEQLRTAAAALAACVAREDSGLPGGTETVPPENPDADWESRLAAVNAAVGAAPQPDWPGGAGPEAGGGSPLAPHQAELVEAITTCPGNCVAFLPLGGMREARLHLLPSGQPPWHAPWPPLALPPLPQPAFHSPPATQVSACAP